MRDLPPFICLIVLCAISLFFVPWWTSLALFVLGFCLFGFLTYLHAIKTIRWLTGLNYRRANKLYRATMTGNWSEIGDDELRSFQHKSAWNSSKLQKQLATLIISERVRRNTEHEFERDFNKALGEELEERKRNKKNKR